MPCASERHTVPFLLSFSSPSIYGCPAESPSERAAVSAGQALTRATHATPVLPDFCTRSLPIRRAHATEGDRLLMSALLVSALLVPPLLAPAESPCRRPMVHAARWEMRYRSPAAVRTSCMSGPHSSPRCHDPSALPTACGPDRLYLPLAIA